MESTEKQMDSADLNIISNDLDNMIPKPKQP